MKIGIPREIKNHEYRVGVTPDGVQTLIAAGHTVLVEQNAGTGVGFADAAAQVTKLQVSTSYNPFGSDHVSFLDVGLPAILAIDSDWNRYDHYHRTTDTADKLTPELAHEILKMNAGALALLAQ